MALIFRQLIDERTHTYTYLLGDPVSGEAALIDTVDRRVERDLQIVSDLGLTLKYVLDTHVHADHITGAGQLRTRTGASTVAAASANVGCVDTPVRGGDVLSIGATKIEVRETPGHTAGCLSFVVRTGERTLVFTGDALLIRGCGRTDFQQGDAATLYNSIHTQLFSLPPETEVYPGHDYRGHTSSSVAEEVAHNPRLGGGTSQADFIAIMDGLNLADPRLMDIAVPANLVCGVPQIRSLEPDELRILTVANVTPYRIIDVREHDEFHGELGHLDTAELVPLMTLSDAAADWPRDERLLVVCRSGARSNKACEVLIDLGFSNVTNFEGGMRGWRA